MTEHDTSDPADDFGGPSSDTRDEETELHGSREAAATRYQRRVSARLDRSIGPRRSYLYPTLAAAERAIDTAERDVVGDFGPEYWDAGYADIVRGIAVDCAPDVAVELCRREGIDLPWPRNIAPVGNPGRPE